MNKIVLFCSLLLLTSWVQAEQHVFYSHGAIVEGRNPRPVHPRFGVYDYPAILAALKKPGRVLHAIHRPAGQSVQEAANALTAEVRTLLNKSVPVEAIVLVGFSRGGVISLKASEQLQQERLRLVLMASCFSGLAKRPMNPVGQLYSLYERSDQVQSCQPLLATWPQLHLADEQVIETGLGHGAFYQPRRQWLDIVDRWLDNPKDEPTANKHTHPEP